MNYLAHAYLSFENHDVMIGNMISDFVKGKTRYDFKKSVQKGISLHREIDAYTDKHPVTNSAKQMFRKDYGRYAGAFIDVVYDHFLANDSNYFKDEQFLKEFSKNTYSVLEESIADLPLKFQQVFPYMKTHDWLYNYRFRWGMERSMEGLVRRAKYLTDSAPAFITFNENYDELQQYYDEFFPALRSFVLAIIAEEGK
jgi:acyl carrier protein phosphodiesterase